MAVTTLDDMLAQLQALKTAGMPGDTPMALPGAQGHTWNKAQMAKVNLTVHPAAVAKDEFGKGWELCRLVSRSGVRVLMIS